MFFEELYWNLNCNPYVSVCLKSWILLIFVLFLINSALTALFLNNRLLWICMVIGGFVASNLLVETFWLRYKSNPTRLSVVTKHEPITRLVLPGITICPVDRIDSQRAGHFISRLWDGQKKKNLNSITILNTYTFLQDTTTEYHQRNDTKISVAIERIPWQCRLPTGQPANCPGYFGCKSHSNRPGNVEYKSCLWDTIV